MSVYAIVSKTGKVQEAPVNLRSKYNNVVGFHLLTDEQRQEHGWYPCTVLNESYNPIYQIRSEPKKVFDGNHVTVTYTITDKPSDLIEAQLAEFKRKCLNDIDQVANDIIFNTAGHRTEEYKMALEQAQAWKATNYDGPAPIAVLADTIEGVRDEITACERILTTAKEWTDKLMSIRFTRLQAKAKIDQTQTHEQAQEVMQQYQQDIQQ